MGTAEENRERSQRLLQQYQVIAARRNANDTLLWQAPLLSLTGQAFLFTAAATLLAAAKEGAHPGCLYSVALMLAWVAACASLHLMAKHRFFEVEDSVYLRDLELILELPCRHISTSPSHRLGSAYCSWIVTLAVFGAAAGWFFVASLPYLGLRYFFSAIAIGGILRQLVLATCRDYQVVDRSASSTKKLEESDNRMISTAVVESLERRLSRSQSGLSESGG
ncbi:hypothetical protein NA78x_004440 [Anatilimnocola sp. NA78]|uniref:hypothetical protein n=1 Tax=Anatilimnocola sp. NA78 TaxID=3415683 RepID=UPI003CE53943